MSLRIVPATTDLRTFAGAAPESDELLSFGRVIFVNRLFTPLAGRANLRLGGLQGSDSVSTQHPPLKPLPDPIALKIQFPSSQRNRKAWLLLAALLPGTLAAAGLTLRHDDAQQTPPVSTP